jgi:DNA-binding response OmpR family regulator
MEQDRGGSRPQAVGRVGDRVPHGSVVLAEADDRRAKSFNVLFSHFLVSATRAHTREEMLFLIGRTEPRLVVVGSGLGAEDQIAESIMAVRAHDAVPIVAAVSDLDSESVDVVRSAGVSGLISIDWPLAKQRVALEPYLRIAIQHEERQAVVLVGTLQVNGLAYDATVDGKRLQLTTREFEILHLLARHAGTVVPTETIHAIWPGTQQVSRQTVATNIHRVRTRLAGAADITVVKGIGYRLDVPHQTG